MGVLASLSLGILTVNVTSSPTAAHVKLKPHVLTWGSETAMNSHNARVRQGAYFPPGEKCASDKVIHVFPYKVGILCDCTTECLQATVLTFIISHIFSGSEIWGYSLGFLIMVSHEVAGKIVRLGLPWD